MPASRRSVAVVLRAEVANYKRDLAEAGKATRKLAEEATQSSYQAQSAFGRLEQSVLRNREQTSQLATGFAVAGTALVAFAGLAVTRAAEFDAAMSSVQAATMESAANMELLRQAALDAGAQTVYSATEAAGAIEQLAKAGVSTQDILSGGLSGALNLAASDNIAVGEAAEIAASAMTQFGLAGEDVTHIADLLAAGAGKAQGGVLDLGQALNQSGLVANQVGLSIEETTGSLAAFASAGLVGSDAGTSFRAMLLRLASPTQESAELMAELGINAYDAQGNFIGMTALAGELTDSLSGLTSEQRNAALAQIFGQDAIRTSTILYEQGEDGIREWISAVNDQGYAAEQAAIRLDNLKGDIEALVGAVETALIQTGEGGNAPLRFLVEQVTNLVTAFTDLPPAVTGVTTVIAGAGGLALLGTAGVLKVATAAADAKAAFQALEISGRAAGLAITGATVGIAALTAGITFWATKTAEAKARADAYADSVRMVGAAASDAAAQVAASAFVEGTNADWGWWQELQTGYESAADAMEALGISVAEAAAAVAGSDDEFEAFMAPFRAAQLDEYNVALGQVIIKLEQQRSAMQDARSESEQMDAATSGLTDSQGAAAASFGDATAAMSEQAAAVGELVTAWAEANASFIDVGGAYQQVIDQNVALAEETAAATSSSKDSWQDYYDGVTVSMDEYLLKLEEQAAAQSAWETNMLLLSGRVSQGTLDHLARLGPEGAALVADLVDASDEEMQRFDDVFAQSGADATSAFAGQLSQAAPVLAAIGSQLGTEAAAAAASAIASGEKDVQAVINEYELQGVTFPVLANTAPAQGSIDQFLARNRAQSIRIQTIVDAGGNTGGGYATGGAVFGVGTETSDSILARVSHNEHIVSAAEVKGAGGHAALARLRAEWRSGAAPAVARFAQGGSPAYSGRPMINVTAPAHTPGPMALTKADKDYLIAGLAAATASAADRIAATNVWSHDRHASAVRSSPGVLR